MNAGIGLRLGQGSCSGPKPDVNYASTLYEAVRLENLNAGPNKLTAKGERTRMTTSVGPAENEGDNQSGAVQALTRSTDRRDVQWGGAILAIGGGLISVTIVVELLVGWTRHQDQGVPIAD